MQSFFSKIISFVFPETCVVCRKENVSLCAKCLQSFKQAPYQEKPWIHSLFSYQDTGVRKAIHALKFKHVRSIADYLAPYMHETIQDIQENNINLLEEAQITLLPVPKMRAHVRTRGFDAITYLCQEIQKQDPLHYTVCSNAMIRLNTRAQTGLSKEERLVNMRNAFCVIDRTLLTDTTICIIDDVVTTGSTLRELEKMCLHAGAKKVFAVTIAH